MPFKSESKIRLAIVAMVVFWSCDVLTKYSFCSASASTVFYVASDGDDSENGTSPETAWATIERVQQEMDSLQPGDRVLFRAGDRFQGSLDITASGLPGQPTVFGRFGRGLRPIVDASIELTNWTDEGGGIWSAPNPTGSTHPEALFVDSKPQRLAREPDANDPNGGYRFIDSHSGHTTIVDVDLTDKQDWTGAEAAIRTQRWILDRVRIQNHSGNTIQLVSPGTNVYEIQNAFGYFFQDHPAALDQDLEWCFDSETELISICLADGGSPAQHVIRVPVENCLINLSGVNDIRIEGLELSGARRGLVEGVQVSRVTLINCELSRSGGDGVVMQNAQAISVVRNQICDCQNNGLAFSGSGQCQVRGNLIERIGSVAGMGRGPDGNYFAVIFEGQESVINNNRLFDIGYIGIGVTGPQIIVHSNQIERFCFVKDDGGGIYISGYGPLGTQGSQVKLNFVRDGYGAGAGTYPDHVRAANGVYVDDFAEDVLVELNTASNCGAYGIFIHNGQNIDLIGNTCFGNHEAQLAMAQDSIAPTNIRGCNLEGNVFCARGENELAADFSSEQDDIDQFGNFSNNVYLNLYRSDGYLRRRFNSASGDPQLDFMDLGQWQTATNHDLDSSESQWLQPLTEAYDFIGPERVTNGQFDSSIAGWNCWMLGGGGNECELEWDNQNGLESGSLQLGFSFLTGASYALAFQELGPVAKGDQLLCRFHSLGTNPNSKLEVELRQDASVSYDPLSPIYELEAGETREEHSIVLNVSSDDPNARIDIGMGEEVEKYWIDNVSIRVVEVNHAALDQRFVLLTNLALNSREVSKFGSRLLLTENFFDARGTFLTAGTKISLLPNESKLLIRSAGLE